MPLVVFESPYSAAVEVEAPAGAQLIDVCDDNAAPVPFSCRSASCGTCRIEILEGADRLEPPGDEERTLLEILGDDPLRYRLACQARLRGEGLIRIRPPSDW